MVTRGALFKYGVGRPPARGVPLLVPGTTAVGAWAETDPAALGILTQGAPGDYGYEEHATANWVSPMGLTVRGGVAYIGVVASKGPTYGRFALADPFGVKEVWFSCANGPWTTVSARTPLPGYTGPLGEPIDAFVVGVDPTTFASSGEKETRAIVVPWVGTPFVLQVPTVDAQTTISGKIDPKTATWVNLADTGGGTLARTNYSPAAWSLLVNVDKTGTALPNITVWLDTINGDDGRTGLSKAQAVRTAGEAKTRALAAKAAAGFSATDAGGIEIIYTGAGGHAWGLAGTPAIWPAATQYLTISPDPDLPPFSIDLTTAAGSYGWNCEKVRIKPGFKHSGNFTLQFCNSGGGTSVQYFDTLVEGLFSDGGPGVDEEDGQPNAAATFFQPNGHNANINCIFTRRVGAGTNKTTLSTNNLYEDLSSNGDLNDDVKVSVFDTAKDLTQAGVNHLDHIQFKGGRSNHIIIDYTAVVDIASQVIFHDERCGANIAIIRPKIVSTSSGPALGFEGGSGLYELPREYHIHDPQIVGTTTMWPPQAGDAQNVRITLTGASIPGKWGTEFRYGMSALWPDSTGEPASERPPEHPLIANFGKRAFSFLIDAEEVTSLSCNSGSFENVTQVRNIRSLGGPRILLGNNPFATVNGSPVVTVTHVAHPWWNGAKVGLPSFAVFGDFLQDTSGSRPTTSDIYPVTYIDADHYSLTMPGNAGVNGLGTGSGGGSNATVSEARDTPFAPPRLLPLRSSNGFNGRPCIIFNPDNAVSTAGRSLHRMGGAELTGAAVVHEFFLIDQEEADAETQTHHLFTYGGASSTNSRSLYRTSNGTTPKLNWRTTSAAAIQAPGLFKGRCIVHAYYDTTLANNVGVGLFNAAQPTFAFDTTRYGFGTVAAPTTTNPPRQVIGGSSGVDGGAAGSWLKFRLNLGIAFKQALTETDIAYVFDQMAARANL